MKLLMFLKNFQTKNIDAIKETEKSHEIHQAHYQANIS